MKKRHKFLAGVASVLVVCLIWVIWGNVTVGLTRITVTDADLPAGSDGFRIAHVSDLHNSDLWKKTVEKLKSAAPDIICITGDLVDCSRTDVKLALDFVAEAVKIAPCYYVPGNHEYNLNRADSERLLSGMESLGVTVLCNRAVVLDLGNVRIGLFGFTWGIKQYSGQLPEDLDYTILLAHDPAHFEAYAQGNYDLILSGHVHGGQFRLPIVGGLYGPGQGVLPTYDSGLYQHNGSFLYVSRGIGNSSFPIRFGNRPEVVLLTLRVDTAR